MNTAVYSAMQQSIQHSGHPIDIVAVTKTHSYSVVQGAYAMGIRHIGENRVEEAEAKILESQKDHLADICWHMIGHVQTRKVKDVVRLFDRVDSVDSVDLLSRLNDAAMSMQKKLHVLLEINVALEQGKYGFIDALALSHDIFSPSHICIDGCMTMAPYTIHPEENRVYFNRLYTLSYSLSQAHPYIGRALSMGTSCDWQVAIQEGATEIRVGSTLFGNR